MTTCCSLPRLHWCGEGYHSTFPFLALPPIHCGRTFEFENITFLNPHPISRSFDWNLHDFEFISTSIAHIFMLFVGLFLTFVAILYVCTLCMCAQVLQVRLLNSKQLFFYTHTLF